MLLSFKLIETMLNLYLNPLMAVVGILYIRMKNVLLKAKLNVYDDYHGKYWFFDWYGLKIEIWFLGTPMRNIMRLFLTRNNGHIFSFDGPYKLEPVFSLWNRLIIERHHCHLLCDEGMIIKVIFSKRSLLNFTWVH